MLLMEILVQVIRALHVLMDQEQEVLGVYFPTQILMQLQPILV